MNYLVPIAGDKKPFVTADGSISFYNLSYKEAYHAKSIGAYNESLYKFVYASGILQKLEQRDVRLLDICFGLGYNLAVTLNELRPDLAHRLHIVSLEKDPDLSPIVQKSHLFWPVNGYRRLRKLLKEGRDGLVSLEFVFGDAVQTIQMLTGTFDVIYFDPFSKRKNPDMWTPEIFGQLRRLLRPDCIAVTYASSRVIREEMAEAGLTVTPHTTLPEGFQPGTMMSVIDNNSFADANESTGL